MTKDTVAFLTQREFLSVFGSEVSASSPPPSALGQTNLYVSLRPHVFFPPLGWFGSGCGGGVEQHEPRNT